MCTKRLCTKKCQFLHDFVYETTLYETTFCVRIDFVRNGMCTKWLVTVLRQSINLKRFLTLLTLLLTQITEKERPQVVEGVRIKYSFASKVFYSKGNKGGKRTNLWISEIPNILTPANPWGKQATGTRKSKKGWIHRCKHWPCFHHNQSVPPCVDELKSVDEIALILLMSYLPLSSL